MKAAVLSREQKESCAQPNPGIWRVGGAILALLVFLPVDTTAQKPPQPPILTRPTAEPRLLALSAPLLWPSSTMAQQVWHAPAPVNLGPTINLMLVDMHPASSRSNNLSLTPSTRPGQPHARMKFLANDEGKLSHELFAAIPLASGRFQVAHVAPAESERSQRLPAVYQEDTPFSSQVRMPVADLWRGRLQFDGFYRDISTDSVFRGILQSSGVWATPGTLAPRSATSYGIRLSFRMPHIHTRTLCRYFVGGRR